MPTTKLVVIILMLTVMLLIILPVGDNLWLVAYKVWEVRWVVGVLPLPLGLIAHQLYVLVDKIKQVLITLGVIVNKILILSKDNNHG
jgi:hypothetical protein